MKTLIATLWFIIIASSSQAQSLQVSLIQPNEAAVSVHNLPYYSWATLTYQWDVIHEESNTTWTWHTANAYKNIPLFWEGHYTIRCRVRYINKYSGSSYGYYDLFTTIYRQ